MSILVACVLTGSLCSYGFLCQGLYVLVDPFRTWSTSPLDMLDVPTELAKWEDYYELVLHSMSSLCRFEREIFVRIRRGNLAAEFVCTCYGGL